jgi:acyl-CoA thioester hydrolase
VSELPFRHLLRVRYLECDAQKIVFNARWGDYVDVAVTEHARTIWGPIDGSPAGLDYRLVRQVFEWRAPAHFDDVLEARIRCAKIGTTSFTLSTEFRRWGEDAVLVTAETTYVVVDPATGVKQPLPPGHRAALERGAPGVITDHAGATGGAR